MKNMLFVTLLIQVSILVSYSQPFDSNWELPPEINTARLMVKGADSLYNSGNYVEAAKLFEKIVGLNPEDIESKYRLALSFHRIGDYERAIHYHKMVVEFMESDHTDGLRHYKRDGLYNLACAYSLNGDVENSLQTLHTAIDAGFDNSGLLSRDSDLDNIRADVRLAEVFKKLRVKEFQSAGSNTSDPTPEQIREGVDIVLNTIKKVHPNPYRHFAEAEWDARADGIIRKADQLTETAYLVELMGLVGMAGDVHTSAFPRGETLLQDSYPLRFWKFSDGLYVRAASEQLKHLVGAKVIAMNGVPIDEAWELLINKFPSENEWMSTYLIQLFIQFPSLLHVLGLSETETGGTWTFLMPDGKSATVDLKSEKAGGYFTAMSTSFAITAPEGWTQGHDSLEAVPLWLRAVAENYWYEIIKERRAVYFQMNIPRHDRSKPWDIFLDELFTTINTNEAIDRLIIDLRHHEGGWDYMAKALVRKILQSPKIDRPGGLYIISHRVTQSAGLAFIGWMEMATHPIIVGEPPGAHPLLKNGAWGNHRPLELPGTTIRFRVSTHNENMTDAIDDRHIIAPDIPTTLTYDDYKAGKDNALEAALDFPLEKGHIFFEDAGGRPIPTYLPWRRLSQMNAFEKARKLK